MFNKLSELEKTKIFGNKDGNKVGNNSTAKHPFFTHFALFAPLSYCMELY